MAGVGKSSVLRMSGLNSGLDTEAIVTAMTAATKLKITTNQRKVMKLEAQQDAYRAVADKINAFKDKYFDILNNGSYLKTAGGFNKYTSKISSGGADVTPPGVKVTTNSAAIPGNYKVEVKSVATQSKYTSASLDSQQDFKLQDYNEEGATYALKVTVGSQAKVISFKAGANEEETLANINKSLEAFGKSNDGSGLVSVKQDSDGNYIFNSLEKKAITTSDTVKLDSSVILNTEFENTAGSITVTIDGETKTISLATIKQDYYSDLFTDKGNGFDENGYAKLSDSATDAEKKAYNTLISSFENRVKDMYQDHLGGAYEAFMDESGYYKRSGTYSEDWENMSPEQQRIFNEALTAKQNEQWEAAYNKTAEALYNASPAGKITGDLYVPWNKWLEDYKSTYTMDDFKADNSGWEEGYNNWVSDNYDAYVAGEADPENIKSFDEWAKEYKKLYPQNHYQDLNSNWAGKFNDFAADEYNRYAAYMNEKHADDEDFELQSFEDWSADYMNKFNVDDFKAKMRNGDVAVAEAEAYYNFSYNEYNAYTKYSYDGISESDFINSYKNDSGAIDAAAFFNSRSIENSINNTKFSDGTKLEVNYEYNADGTIKNFEISAYKEVDGVDGDNNPIKNRVSVDLGISSNSGYNFGLNQSTSVSNTISTSTKLSELGLKVDTPATYKQKVDNDGKAVFDSDGKPVYTDEIEKEAQYKMTIGGVDFSFDASTTISQMMSRVNSSEAGVNMTFSSLTNTFEITNKEYGTGSDFEIDTDNQILQALGFASGSYTSGSNMRLEINGIDVETASNSYTIDGTTFSFNSLTEVGTKFEVEVSRDTDKIKDLVKDFVKDYNELIKFVYGYVDEKPKSDYHFLTDADKEEMALSDKQEELWEDAAKKGILYNDSTLTSIMSKFRTALYSANTGMAESNFALFSMGITTSSNYRDHGLLVIKEDEFDKAFETNFDDIVNLFTNSTNGIMTQFDKIIEGAVKPTGKPGERGTLIDKAGVVNGSSTTDNTIYNQIKRLNTMITSLERRYEQQQDRYWKVYTALEKQMGSLNSQTSYISQLMGGGQ